MSAAVRLTVWSDYLCPWCYNAAHRLARLEQEFGPRLQLEWKSFLLRPSPRPRGGLERFRAYTRSWERPAAEADAPPFRVWTGDAGPPTHSVPPHLVAKAAAQLGDDAFRRVHERLLRAYFGENRDITDAQTLRELWGKAGLPDAEFGRRDDPALLEQVLDEYHEAGESGASGVPALRMEGNPAVIVGAHRLELYRRWIDRTLERR